MKLIYLSTSKLHRNRANLVQTLHTVQALVRAGCRVELFMPPVRGGADVDQRLKEVGIENRLDLRPTQLLHSRWKPLGFLPLCLIMRRRLLNADRILVRSHYISEALVRHRIPHWFEVHDVGHLKREGYLDRLVSACTEGTVTHLLPISRAAANALEQAGAPGERVKVIPCGADYGRFSSVPLPGPEAMRFLRIMYIGRISRDRGLDIFLHLARSRVGEVWLIGEVEDGEELLRGEEGVRLVPFVPHRDVPAWYGRCGVVLLPYQSGLTTSTSFSPLKLFEAMAAGRPIVASDLPALREILSHGETGLLVPPDDPGAWLEAVEALRSDPEMAVALGKRAREAARSYSWEARARRLMEIE